MIKNITIIGINYFPEDTAIGLYTTQLAEYLAKNGFKVNIVTGFPYYPQWKIKSDYKNKPLFYKETLNNIDIYRYRQYVPKNPTFIKRIIHLLDFTIGSLFNIFKIKNTDLVLCIVPFTSTILLGKILSKVRKAKLWVHIQDFEFDAASESNILRKKNKKSILLKFLFGIERFLINRVDITSTISKAMLKKLEKKSKAIKPKFLLPNWVDANRINPDTYIQHKYLKSNRFKILYSGNIGKKQDWKFFIKLAKKLKNNTKIEIIIVGDGASKDWLLNELKDYPNIHYHQPVIYEDLSNLLCSADVHILFQKNNLVDTVMPSKILAMMASKKPSIITGNLKSEVATIINDSYGGYYFDSNNLDGVLLAIDELMNNNDKAEQFGKNARIYISENFSSQKVLFRFKELINSAILNSN